jgi:hypothetical protein
MLDSTKINFTFKKLSGKQHTWNSKKWYEEEDGIILFQHAKEIWIDRITENPPEIETDLIKPHLGLVVINDISVQGRRSFYAFDSQTNKKIKGFIPPSYGNNYNVKVFVDGVKIPTTHSSNWMFDYANGILVFENTPPVGTITISAYEYIGRTFQQYLDAEFNSIAIGILGIDDPQNEYVIQHNMASFDVDVIIYCFDEVDGVKYWKKDVVPLMLMDENRVKIQLTEKQSVRFIIKSYEMPDWLG